MLTNAPSKSKKTPNAVDQEPSQPVLRADEGPFPQTSQPGMHVGWDEVAEAPKFHPLNIYPPALHGLQ